LVQVLVRDVKSKYYIFSELGKPKTIWKQLRHLRLIKSKSIDKGLPFNTDELNDFFVNSMISLHNAISSKIYLGEEVYDDVKFYWANIE